MFLPPLPSKIENAYPFESGDWKTQSMLLERDGRFPGQDVDRCLELGTPFRCSQFNAASCNT